MRTLIFLSSMLLFNASADMVFPGEEWSVVSPESQGVDAKQLQVALDFLESASGKDGVSEVMVVRNGQVIWAGDQVESLHPVWSVTKSFGGISAGLLYDDGLLKPDTRLAELVPDYAEQYPEVTVHHALTLTDGFGQQDWESMTVEPPQYAPGEYFHYAPGVNPLARAMTVAGGESLADRFQHRIAEPIAMQQWEWGVLAEENGVVINNTSGVPPTSFSTTASDLARVGHLLLNNGQWNGQQLLSQEWIDMATQAQVGEAPPWDKKGWYLDLAKHYGYLFWVNQAKDGELLWRHAPAGVYALQGNRNNICWVIPEWNMVIVRTGLDKVVGRAAYDGFFERLAPAVNTGD